MRNKIESFRENTNLATAFFIAASAIVLLIVLCGNAYADEPDPLAYSGPYVDIVTELEMREPAEGDGFSVYKVDAETGMSMPLMMTQSGAPDGGMSVTLRLPREDGVYTLVFDQDGLAGYYAPEDSFNRRIHGQMRTDEETCVALLNEYKTHLTELQNKSK